MIWLALALCVWLLAFLACLGALVIGGSGPFSVDRLRARSLKRGD